METISFKLDAFEGPLDLLLHLVSKHKLNIYDIEISLLLEQYLAYIDGIETKDYEQAADFLEMAARLIYIKTCYLLPQPEEAEELKKELQGRMIEYSLCKLAAQRLREDYAGGSVFVRQPVKLPVNKTYTRFHDKQELYDAYMMISAKVKEYKPLRANMFSPIVSRRIVSVESKITEILGRLYSHGSFEMSRLYDGMEDRSERIAAFLAVLELTKSGRIILNEDNTLIELRQPHGEEIPEAEPAEEAEELPEEAEPIEETVDVPEGAEPIEEAVDVPEGAEQIEDAVDVSEEAEPIEEAVDVPEEADPIEEAEEAPEEKPARNYSVQLAQSTHTLTLRVEDETELDEPEAAPETDAEPELPAEPVGEFVSLFDEVEEYEKSAPEHIAVAVFAPMIADTGSREEQSAEAEEQTEPSASGMSIKPNYYARRYYWGYAPLSGGRRCCREAYRLRIRNGY